MENIKDSVEVALELDEKSVYSHIAHESAEDIIRIISSLDAERAKLRGEVIYYTDDWDALIRERMAKGKRHTAFDFYNPALLDIWEEKVKESKRIQRMKRFYIGVFGASLLMGVLATVLTGEPWFAVVLAFSPLLLWIQDRTVSSLDFIYHELTQFFIDELREIVVRHSLNPERYKFKLFSGDYFGVEIRKSPSGRFAVVVTKNEG